MSLSDKFQTAVNFMLKNEGGLVNNKNDPGGLTKYGVTLKSAEDFNKDGVIDEKDIQYLTFELAVDFYYRHYWKDYNLEKLPDLLAKKVFDTGVNIGMTKAIKILQNCIADLASHSLMMCDGFIGDRTLSVIKGIELMKIIREFILRLKEHYTMLSEHNPKLKTFIKGWFRRADRL